MAQALFDAFSGVAMDNQTVLTVQSLIEAHNRSTIDFESNVECSAEEEDDVFQCGKCKKQFISLPDFIIHKKTHYVGTQEKKSMLKDYGEIILKDFEGKELKSNSSLKQSTNYEELKDDDSTETDNRQPLILNGSDILSFSIEQTGLNVSSPSQVLPPLESGETYLTSSDKTLQIESGDDNNTYRMEAFQNQIIIAAQMPSNCIMQDDVLEKQDLELTQEELAYLNQDCLITSVDKELGETVTVSVLRVMQDTLPLAEEQVTKDIESEKKLKCLHCGKMFIKNFDLQQHVRSHTGERPYQCVVCGRAFTQKSNVKKHMATHKVWPNQLRTLLPKDSESANGNEEQQETDNLVNSYHCQFCPDVFQNFYQLKAHRKQHSHKKVYKCIQKNCSETFEDLDLFVEHTHVHADEAEYHCHLCNKEFGSLDDLGTHQYQHGIRPKPSHKTVTCKKCKNKFSSPETLEKHLAVDSHNYSCPKCLKVFPCERFLRRHMAIHATVPKHACEQCGKRFKTEQYLNIHKVIHSDDKPYVCKICSVAFNRQDKLTRHNLVHDPVRKFKCPFSNHLGCDKEFNRKDKLQQHILTHSSTKEFACKRCKRGFKRHCQLKQHEKACLARDIPCKDCGHVTNDLDCYKKSSDQSTKTKGVKRKRKSNKSNDSKVQDSVPTIEIVVLPMLSTEAEEENGVYRVLMPSGDGDPIDLTPTNTQTR